jgi:hypothetical protein
MGHERDLIVGRDESRRLLRALSVTVDERPTTSDVLVVESRNLRSNVLHGHFQNIRFLQFTRGSLRILLIRRRRRRRIVLQKQSLQFGQTLVDARATSFLHQRLLHFAIQRRMQNGRTGHFSKFWNIEAKSMNAVSNTFFWELEFSKNRIAKFELELRRLQYVDKSRHYRLARLPTWRLTDRATARLRRLRRKK